MKNIFKEIKDETKRKYDEKQEPKKARREKLKKKLDDIVKEEPKFKTKTMTGDVTLEMPEQPKTSNNEQIGDSVLTMPETTVEVKMKKVKEPAVLKKKKETPDMKSTLKRVAPLLGIIVVLIAALGIMGLFEDEEEPAPETDKPATEESSEDSTDDAEEEEPAVDEEPDTEEMETIEISTDERFKKLLSDEKFSEDDRKEFLYHYSGQKIRFDGSINQMDNNEDYKTRYNLFICVGDFDPNGGPGPDFYINDVNVLDLNLVGGNIPETFGSGSDITITAIVKGVWGDGYVELEPVSMSFR